MRKPTFLDRARKTRAAGAAFCLIGAALGAGFAHAQVVPPSADPGRIEQRFEQPRVPQSRPETTVPVPGVAPAPAEAARIRFELRRIEIQGHTVYTDAELAETYQDFLNKDVSLADIYTVAERITAKYRADGYVLSRAVVPAQTISDGTVRITVVEGFVSNVIFQGEPNWLHQTYAEKIKASRPLRFSDLERYLLLMNDVPGTVARGVFAPSRDVPGGSDLTVVLDRKPVDGFVGMDNRGTRFSGPFQILTGLGFNDVTGMGERVTLRYITATQTDELRYGEFGADVPISTEGTRFQLIASRSNTHSGYTLKPLDVKGYGTTVTGRVTHPLIRSRERNLSLFGSFTARDSEQEILGTENFDDRLRIVRVGASYDFIDSWRGITLIAVEVSQGLDAFGARETGSSNLSRAQGRSDFTKVTLDVSRLQNIVGNLNLFLAFSAQKTPNQPLLASEEFGLGGAQFGRAYDPSELTGDDGWAARAELQYNDPIPFELIRGYQLYAFYDGGVVYNHDAGSERSESLASAGVGTRFNLTDQISGYVELAVPLTRGVQGVSTEPDEQDDPRIFFSLVARF